MPQCEPDIIQPFYQAVSLKLSDYEQDRQPLSVFNRLPLEIDRQLITDLLLRAAHDLRHLIRSQNDRQHAVLKTVVREDVRERRRDDRSEPKLTERPRRMLARRAATEILIRYEYRRALVTRLVQHKRRIRTPVVKQKLPKPRALDAFQELLRNNLIRIDIRAIERRHESRMFLECVHLI